MAMHADVTDTEIRFCGRSAFPYNSKYYLNESLAIFFSQEGCWGSFDW